MSIVDFIIGFLTGGVIGGLIIWVLRARATSDPDFVGEAIEQQLKLARESNEKLSAELRAAGDEVKHLHGEYESTKTKLEMLTEQLKDQGAIEETMSKIFSQAADAGLVKQGEFLSEKQKKTLEEVLSPLKDSLKVFSEKVESNQTEAGKTNAALIQQIISLTELNKSVGVETTNLTRALKGDNKAQGNWGEMVLERVLEASGLKKDLNYRTQTTSINQEGETVRPDIVVDLPDSKHVIIDSKVSLTAYEEYASFDEGTPERSAALKRHVESIKTHISGLSSKGYHTASNTESPEFVLMFIPIESSFSISVRADEDLFDYAWQRNIVMVSPSTLLATLRTVASLWKMDLQNRHTVEIADKAGRLYDKFVGFVQDLQKVQSTLSKSNESLESAMKKLSTGSGNLVRKSEELKKLGIKASKSLPSNLLEEDFEGEDPQV